MAKPLLVLDEVLAMLGVIGVSPKQIDAFTKQATAVLERKNTRAVDAGEEATDTILVASGFGQRSRKGFVDFTLNDQRTQMPPDKAREVGIMLLEAAEAAISDQIFVTLLEKTGLDTEAAGRMLIELREIRQGTRGVSWPT